MPEATTSAFSELKAISCSFSGGFIPMEPDPSALLFMTTWCTCSMLEELRTLPDIESTPESTGCFLYRVLRARSREEPRRGLPQWVLASRGPFCWGPGSGRRRVITIWDVTMVHRPRRNRESPTE